jgi:phosphoribosyl 1,2-cyclic phosphodiesterase
MKVAIWGSRGSIASAGPETNRYGGNTACVEVRAAEPGIQPAIILDAGTGLRRAGIALAGMSGPIHLLLTHLHMDHIQGLGFFRPLFEPERELHVWGPPSTTRGLRARLTRYLSPPLFPVRIRDLGSRVELHDAPVGTWRIGEFEVTAASVIHPGPTLAYRIARGARSMAYLPDHEPVLGGLSGDPNWTSGHDLAAGVDLLLHDGQYSAAEYETRVGWGHSSVDHAVALADLAGARRLALFHHDPDHDDATIDGLLERANDGRTGTPVIAAAEGVTYDLRGEDDGPNGSGQAARPGP